MNKIIDFVAASVFEAYVQALKDAQIKYHLEEMRYEIKNNNEIVIIIPDKIKYQEFGRKARVKRVPIKALIKWGIKYKIQGINKFVWAIQTSIYKNGISAKPVKFDINSYLLKIDLQPYIFALNKTLTR